jgi:hypothetical protein
MMRSRSVRDGPGEDNFNDEARELIAVKRSMATQPTGYAAYWPTGRWQTGKNRKEDGSS